MRRPVPRAWAARAETKGMVMRACLVAIASVVLFGGVASSGEGELVLFSRGVMEDIGEKEKPEDGERGGQLKEVKLYALRGEYEPFTFAFHNNGTEPLKLKATVRDLLHDTSGTGMIKIPASEIEIMGLRKGGKLHRRTVKDWHLATKGQLTVPPGRTGRFWVTVHVPEDAPPGGYSGMLDITDGNRGARILVRVHVSKARLENLADIHFYLLGTVSPYGQYYRSVKDPAGVRPKVVEFYREFAAHGMTGICPKSSDFPYREGDIRGLAAEISAAMEAGLKDPVVWNMQALIDAAKGGDRYDFNGRMDNWDDKKGLDRLKRIVQLSQKMRKERGWPEIIYYQIDEPGTQFDIRKWLVRSMHILEVTSKLLGELGVRSHSTITEPIDEKHNRAPRWSKYPDEMRKLWDRSRPHLSVRNYGYGYPQGKTNLHSEMADARRRKHEIWFYNNAAIMGSNRWCARMYWGLWSWRVGLDGVTAWTYPGGRTLQFEMAREGIDDHKALKMLQALIEKGAGAAADRDEAKEFLEELRDSVKLNANGYIGDWADVAHQSMKAQKLGTDWKVVAFGDFKKRLVELIDKLSAR